MVWERECMIRCFLIGLSVVLLAGGIALADTDVSIQPSVVELDSANTVFTVDIWKDSADIEFDGYQTVVRFDPTMVELVSASQETVMTNACWNIWWSTSPGEDSIFISHVLMCGGITVTGPGALSKLEFRALEEGVTTIWSDYFWFTHAGVWEKDVAWHDGDVIIGDQSGVNDEVELGSIGSGLRVFPNPSREFEIEIVGSPNLARGSAPVVLCVYDAQGRTIRTLWSCPPPCIPVSTRWNGAMDCGRKASPGIYFLSLSTKSNSHKHKIILVH